MSGSHAAAVVLFATLALGCRSKTQVVERDFGFDGTCVRCHTGLGSGQVHAGYKLRCIDCHGGNDQVADVPEDAFADSAIYRDPQLIAQSHVLPKAGLARFFYANGVDDDSDGLIDEGPTIADEGGVRTVVDFGEIAEPGLHGEGIGEFVDAEYNRDLDYTRWLNPGDLRVATVGCGGQSSGAQASGTGCHQRLVNTVRRSIMVTQAAVTNGAYYGNESWRSTFIEARDAAGPADDPRKGTFGYVLDFDAIDECIDTSAQVAEPGRGQASFDSACLEAAAAGNDPNAVADAPGNAGLPAFEATQGSIGPSPDVEPGSTVRHEGVRRSRFAWGGTPLMDQGAALTAMHAIPDEQLELIPALADPVDTILRGFRAYYPMNYPGSARNFNFTFGESILPGIADFKTQNPFGRGHSSGCTSCHMLYRYDGAREPQAVTGIGTDGEYQDELVADPTTKHREFDPETQDVRRIGGEQRLVGMTVTQAERELAADGGELPEQQRFYSARHELTTRITTQQCGLCHGFVTRINMAYQGTAEDEQRDPLARNAPIELTTPGGTQVRIVSSWVREEGGVLEVPEGDDIARRARERNRQLEELGLLAGAGGCAAEVFTEDCNNNGELDSGLILRRIGEDGQIIAETMIDEDQNRNGKLDLIDHAPREVSVDGRQLRYVYGGANGSTRLMDIHFERGMHCIDCHMLQDTHGDGNLYHTNWDTIEIECEDCHGAAGKATLYSSGPNGGNNLRGAVDQDGRPFFEAEGDRVIQRSRVTPGLFWEVSQLSDVSGPDSPGNNPRTAIAHSGIHLPAQAAPGAHNQGSSFAGEPGASELALPKLECYSCHTAWTHNCMGCHTNTNFGDKVVSKVLPDGTIEKVAGENEVWFNNRNQAARTNFQLLSLMRSPFVLGYNAGAEGQRLAPFRSSMQVHLSVSDADGNTVIDNATFTTHQALDANSGRANVATSGAAMNQTMPHTVRPREVRTCEQCHTLVDRDGRARNEHILAETYGVGAGRYPYVGDWVLMAGAGGLELFEHKEEAQLLGTTAGASSRFPGIIVNPADRVAGNVEPVLAPLATATDVALIRNFTPPLAADGRPQKPTLRDLAVMTVNQDASGALVISDVSFRGHPTLATRPLPTDQTRVFRLPLPDQAAALAHLAPDVSDPFVYVATGAAGLTAVEITGAPAQDAQAARITAVVPIPGGAAGGRAIEVALAGDIAYVGTDQGTLEIYDLGDPRLPVHIGSVDAGGGQVRGLDVAGFVLCAATSNGLAIFDITILDRPALPAGAAGILAVPGDMREVFYAEGHAYVAAGPAGLLDIDITTPAAPGTPVVVDNTVDAVDVIVSKVPGQTWLLIADAAGDLVGHKLDNSLSTRERCFPDPRGAGCGLDMDFRDPTIMGRDPDADGIATFRMAGAILSAGRRLARPAYWEKIGTQTGRRYRDSFMPGSGVLSYPVMQRMHAIQVCEDTRTVDRSGNGLGEMGLADAAFLSTGVCTPNPPLSRRPAPERDAPMCIDDPAASSSDTSNRAQTP